MRHSEQRVTQNLVDLARDAFWEVNPYNTSTQRIMRGLQCRFHAQRNAPVTPVIPLQAVPAVDEVRDQEELKANPDCIPGEYSTDGPKETYHH